MKKNIFLISFFLFSISSAFFMTQAWGVTDWWLIPRTQTQTSYQYVAYSEGRESGEDLKERAFAQAISMLVREHFGLSVEASEVIVEETEGAQFQFMTKLKSEAILLKGLKLVQMHEERLEDELRVYVQIEMSFKDLARSKNLSGVDEVEHVYGQAKSQTSAVIIKTVPTGAMIEFSSVTKKYYVSGYGNAKFFLPKDTYEMQIHLPGHHIIQKRVKVLTEKQEIVQLLSPIYGELLFELNPRDAKIESLKPVKGSNPYYLPVDRNFKFKISHPDYFDEIVETEINEDNINIKKIHLRPRASSVKFEVVPENAQIYLQGKLIKNNERLKIEAGISAVEIRLNDYQNYYETLTILPNREYPTKIIRLTKNIKDKMNVVKHDPKDESKFSFHLEYNPVLSIGESNSFTPIGFGGHLQWKYLSLGAQFHRGVETKDRYDGTVEKSITDFSYQLRVLFFRTEKTLWYLSGILGAYSKDKEWVKKSSDDTVTRYKYNGGGMGLRYQFTEKFSGHVEYNFISEQEVDKDSRKMNGVGSKSSARAIIGVGYDF